MERSVELPRDIVSGINDGLQPYHSESIEVLRNTSAQG